MKKTREEIFETMQRVFKKKDSETCKHYEPVKMKYDINGLKSTTPKQTLLKQGERYISLKIQDQEKK